MSIIHHHDNSKMIVRLVSFHETADKNDNKNDDIKVIVIIKYEYICIIYDDVTIKYILPYQHVI